MSAFNLSNLNPKDNANFADKATVLLIDSQPNSLSVLQTLLEARFTVFTAANAADALNLLEQNLDKQNLQLIVCEQSINDSDCFTLMSQLHKARPDAIGIIISASRIAEIKRQQSANIFYVLQKPIRPQAMIDTLNHAEKAYHQRIALLQQTEQLNIEIQEISEQLSNKKLQMDNVQMSLARLNKINLNN